MARKKYYAIVLGRNPGLYDEWFGQEGAEAQIKGFPNAVYKSFQSRLEAEDWYTRLSGNSSIPSSFTQSVNSHDEEDYYAEHHKALDQGKVVIYTDGGCDGNPGKGSYGVVLLYKTHRKELSGGFTLTTSNRMEITACITGLQSLKHKSSVVLFSDSSYVVNSVQKGWAARWRENNWQRKEDDCIGEVKNADLWRHLLQLCEMHEVTFIKVRGHAGSTENERCHQLATTALHNERLPIDKGYESEFTEK